MTMIDELRDSVRKAFHSGRLEPAREPGWQTAVDLGWLLVAPPESAGGLGLGTATACALHQELGEVLSLAPLVPAMAVLDALQAAPGFAARQDWIERICGGEYVAAPLLPGGVKVLADGRLEGCLTAVPEADMARYVLVLAEDRVALLPLAEPGVVVIERKVWDTGRRLFDVQLSACAVAPENLVATGADAARVATVYYRSALLGLAAESVGGAAAALAMTIEYLQMRRQFDRPLALFQAIKHRCADLKVALATTEALVWARASHDESSLVECGAAKTAAGEVFAQVCEEAIQLHGGIGLTEEHTCHRFMKRAMLNLQLLGNADVWHGQTGQAALQ